MNLRPLNAGDRLLAALLLAAFLVAGWKIARLAPPSLFAAPPVSAAPASAKPAPRLSREVSPDGRFNFNAQFVSSSPGQAVHAASIVELGDGRLRAVWFSGSREGARDVTIQTAVMDPDTLRWSGESTLLNRQQLQQGLWRYVKKLGNPVIARTPDGSLWLWMVNVSLGGWAGSAITWTRSLDEGATWSEPRRLVTSPFLNISTLVKGAPVFFQDGHIGLPVYHEFITKFGEMVRINAQGEVVDKTRISGSRTSLQPVVLVTGPDEADVYMRSGTATALMASHTTDAGKTWSPTQPSSWPNPDSALAGVVTNAGAQWLALNPAPRNREVLALLQATPGSSFEGVTPWVVEASSTPEARTSLQNYERLLTQELKARGADDVQARAYVASARRQLCGEQRCAQEFSYPYLLQSRDGYLHLVYTWHRTRIKYVRLDPLQSLQAAPAVANRVAASQ